MEKATDVKVSETGEPATAVPVEEVTEPVEKKAPEEKEEEEEPFCIFRESARVFNSAVARVKVAKQEMCKQPVLATAVASGVGLGLAGISKYNAGKLDLKTTTIGLAIWGSLTGVTALVHSKGQK